MAVTATVASGSAACLPALGNAIATFRSLGPSRARDELILKPDVRLERALPCARTG